jgi:hypothetical protein
MRRLRVRVAQLEPTLDQTKRELRLCDRARRTAEAETGRATARVAVLTRAEQHNALIRQQNETVLASARHENADLVRGVARLTAQRDLLTTQLVSVASELRDAKLESEKWKQELAEAVAKAEALVKTSRHVSTSTFFLEESFAKKQLENEKRAERKGFEKGNSAGYAECCNEFKAKELLDVANASASAGRASSAENQVARLTKKMDAFTAALAEARSREKATKRLLDFTTKKYTEEKEGLLSALFGAETRERVFRDRLEEIAVSKGGGPATVATRTATARSVSRVTKTTLQSSTNPLVREEKKHLSNRFEKKESRKKREQALALNDATPFETVCPYERFNERNWLPEVRAPPVFLAVGG